MLSCDFARSSQATIIGRPADLVAFQRIKKPFETYQNRKETPSKSCLKAQTQHHQIKKNQKRRQKTANLKKHIFV